MSDYPPLQELIPQTGPMCLITRLVRGSTAEEFLTAEVDISRQSTFFEQGLGGVSPIIAVEYMAQTVAAYIGLLTRETVQAGGKPQIGFLIGVRSFETHGAVLPEGTQVEITARPDFIDPQAAVAAFACEATVQGRCIATGALSVFRPDDADAFIKELHA